MKEITIRITKVRESGHGWQNDLYRAETSFDRTLETGIEGISSFVRDLSFDGMRRLEADQPTVQDERINEIVEDLGGMKLDVKMLLECTARISREVGELRGAICQVHSGSESDTVQPESSPRPGACSSSDTLACPPHGESDD